MMRLMADTMAETPIHQLHVLVVSVLVMLGEIVSTSRRQDVLIQEWLIADAAVWLVLLYKRPEEVLEPSFLVGEISAPMNNLFGHSIIF